MNYNYTVGQAICNRFLPIKFIRLQILSLYQLNSLYPDIFPRLKIAGPWGQAICNRFFKKLLCHLNFKSFQYYISLSRDPSAIKNRGTQPYTSKQTLSE